MKTIATLLILFFLTSCATNGRVCGGAGGKRCVEAFKKPIEKKYS